MNNTASAVAAMTETVFDSSDVICRINKIEKDIQKQFMERDELIHCMMVTMVARTNMLMIGKPGTAKSAIIKALCSHISGSRYFEWLLNKTSDPSEVFGPYSIQKMQNDEFSRITSGMLPEANIGFLDEIFKSNAPMLNMLLPTINEHVFYNNGTAQPVPLISLFGASNEMPEDDSLKALYDRFLIRYDVEYIKEESNQIKMCMSYLKKQNEKGVQMVFVTLDELNFLNKQMKCVIVPESIIKIYIKTLKQIMRTTNTEISDRRKNECLKLLQASAVLRGARIVEVVDFSILKWALCENQNPSSITAIQTTLTGIQDPFDEVYTNCLNTFEATRRDYENCPTEEKTVKLIETKSILTRVVNNMNRMIIDAKNNQRDVSKYADTLNDLNAYINEIVQASIQS